MALVTGNDAIGQRLCDALGLKGVRSLELRVALDEVVTVKAEFAPQDTQLEDVAAILMREYRLVEVTNEEKDS